MKRDFKYARKKSGVLALFYDLAVLKDLIILCDQEKEAKPGGHYWMFFLVCVLRNLSRGGCFLERRLHAIPKVCECFALFT